MGKQLEVPEQILGACCGVRFVVIDRRAPKPYRLGVQFIIEDDGNWIPKDFTINAYWLADLERVVKTARAAVKETL